MSKYDTEICPFCEKPMATDTDEDEYDRRYEACGKDGYNPVFMTWVNKFCWYGWVQPGLCVGGMRLEDRLIEVLEQRDAARAGVPA